MNAFERIPAPLRHAARAILPKRFVDGMRRYVMHRYYVPGMVSRTGPVAFRWRRHVLRRPPVLHRLVVHITDHCNLNCRGCTHFSNIARPAFADPERFAVEFDRLSSLVPDITEIYLLGGEPLLHPRVEEFIVTARRQFPRSTIKLMSNGVLVTRMPASFWETMHANSTVLVCDLYPIGLPVDDIERLAADAGVALEWTDPRGEFFKLPLDLTGSQDDADAFERCRGVSNCPILRDGRLYPCAYIAYSDLLAERFGLSGLEPCESDSISIFETDDPYEIMGFLLRPVPWCRHCDFDHLETYAWARSERCLDEWTVQPDAPERTSSYQAR